MGGKAGTLLALLVGALLGWVVYPLLLGLSASAAGDIFEAGGLPESWHHEALTTAIFLFVFVIFGGLERLAYLARARRSPEKLKPPSTITSQLLFGLIGLGLVLAVAWNLRGESWMATSWAGWCISLLTWLVVWVGLIACLALAIAIGRGLGRNVKRATASRAPLAAALVGVASAAVLLPGVRSLVTADLKPYDDAVEVARQEPGPSLKDAPAAAASMGDVVFASASLARRPSDSCAESFLRPDGSRRATWRKNESRVRRDVGWRVDVEQLLIDAVTVTCLRGPDEPASYFTTVVTNRIIRAKRRDGREPDGDTCEVDSDPPTPTFDAELRYQNSVCWFLVQEAACAKGDTVRAILNLRAEGYDYPDVAETLGMGVSAVKMRFGRFIDGLPEAIREQCR